MIYCEYVHTQLNAVAYVILPQVVSQFSKGLKDIHLVETSPAMRALQNEKLHPSVAKAGCQLHWHDSVDDITPSDQFSLVVAHEFFDALPVHVLQVCCLLPYSVISLPTPNSRKRKADGVKYWLLPISNLLRVWVYILKRVLDQ